MIELTLPVPTPSVNQLHGRHWSRKAKERKKWGWLVKSERLRLDRVGSPEWVRFLLFPSLASTTGAVMLRSLELDRYGPRVLDHDNFVAGTKQLIDALVAEGFLMGDSPAHLTAMYRQHVGKPYRTEVRIW